MFPAISATAESMDDLFYYWRNNLIPRAWRCLFVLPPWLKAWHSVFSGTSSSEIIIFRDGERIIGAAPLLIDTGKAVIMGSPNVCDYTSIIAAPENEAKVLHSLLDFLASKNIAAICFEGIREDSGLYSHLLQCQESMGYRCAAQLVDMSFEKRLPPSWQEYLCELKGKQRHEIRRKMRRLNEGGDIDLRVIESPEEAETAGEDFLKLFIAGKEDKACFMDEQMSTFFRELLRTMSEAGFLRLFSLYIDKTPAAAALCFEYDNTMYLYNSAYDPQFSALSAGLACKIMSIQHAIEQGCGTYDFLKGAEPYKRHLGGIPVPVCQMKLFLDKVAA